MSMKRIVLALFGVAVSLPLLDVLRWWAEILSTAVKVCPIQSLA